MSSSTTALVSDEPAASPETQCSHLGHSSRTSHCVHVVTEGFFFFLVTWVEEMRLRRPARTRRKTKGEEICRDVT